MPATMHVQDFDNLAEEFYIQQRKVKVKRNEVEFYVSWSLFCTL